MIIFKGEYCLNKNEKKELRKAVGMIPRDCVECAIVESDRSSGFTRFIISEKKEKREEFYTISGGLAVSLNYIIDMVGSYSDIQKVKYISLFGLLENVYKELADEIK